jgi:hypothetical protein
VSYVISPHRGNTESNVVEKASEHVADRHPEAAENLSREDMFDVESATADGTRISSVAAAILESFVELPTLFKRGG